MSPVCLYRFILFRIISYCVCGRDFHLAHNPTKRIMGTWVAFEANGTGLTSKGMVPSRLNILAILVFLSGVNGPWKKLSE